MIRRTKKEQIITVIQTSKKVTVIKFITINNMDKNTVKQITEL